MSVYMNNLFNWVQNGANAAGLGNYATTSMLGVTEKVYSNSAFDSLVPNPYAVDVPKRGQIYYLESENWKMPDELKDYLAGGFQIGITHGYASTNSNGIVDTSYYPKPSASSWTGSKNANDPYTDPNLKSDGSINDVTYYPKPSASSWTGSKNANEPYADQNLTGDGSINNVTYHSTPFSGLWTGSRNTNEPYADQNPTGDGSIRDVTYFPKPDENDWIGVKE